MEYAATFDYPVWLRPRDAHLIKDGVAHDGAVAARLGLPPIPVVSETIALATIILLMKTTGARVHVCRLSSAAAIDMVRAAKAEGLPLTCDVNVHHLHLTELDIADFNPNCHLYPPFRSQRDRDAIRAALADGTIDAICSDHAPVDDDAKELPFQESEPGATGVELLLPLTLRWARESGHGLSRAIDLISRRPAEILGIPAGRLEVGAPADLCLFNPETWWQVTRKSLRSLGKNSPFLGLEVPGQVRYTIIDGHIDFERNHTA